MSLPRNILTLLLGETFRWERKVGLLEDLLASDLDLGRNVSNSPFLFPGGVRGLSRGEEPLLCEGEVGVGRDIVLTAPLGDTGIEPCNIINSYNGENKLTKKFC